MKSILMWIFIIFLMTNNILALDAPSELQSEGEKKYKLREEIEGHDIKAILAAVHQFYSKYNDLEGFKVRVSNSEDKVKVSFYDPDAPLSCRGACGRGSITVILSTPDLRVLSVTVPR